jgi:hypothetical protein
MSDATTLLLELLAVIPNGDRVAALFPDDGVVELPFLHALGMPRDIKAAPRPETSTTGWEASTRTSPSSRKTRRF